MGEAPCTQQKWVNVNLPIWMPPLADLLAPEEHMAEIATVTTESCKTNSGRSKGEASGKYQGQLNLSIELGFCDLFNL